MEGKRMNFALPTYSNERRPNGSYTVTIDVPVNVEGGASDWSVRSCEMPTNVTLTRDFSPGDKIKDPERLSKVTLSGTGGIQKTTIVFSFKDKATPPGASGKPVVDILFHIDVESEKGCYGWSSFILGAGKHVEGKVYGKPDINENFLIGGRTVEFNANGDKANISILFTSFGNPKDHTTWSKTELNLMLQCKIVRAGKEKGK